MSFLVTFFLLTIVSVVNSKSPIEGKVEENDFHTGKNRYCISRIFVSTIFIMKYAKNWPFISNLTPYFKIFKLYKSLQKTVCYGITTLANMTRTKTLHIFYILQHVSC